MNTTSLKKIRSGWFDRTSRLTKIAAESAGTLVSGRVKSMFQNQVGRTETSEASMVSIAHLLKNELGEMKGLLMKVGQIASYANAAVPPAVQEILQSLQDSTPAMSEEMVNNVFLAETGRLPTEIFSEWNPVAIAAASIGQVHRARLHDGAEVAVKVQYPDIEKTMHSDFANASVIKTLLAPFFPGTDVGAVIEEVREKSLDECDYLKEAQNQDFYRTKFSSEKHIYIPKVVHELTTKKILVTEFIVGQRYREFLMRASEDEKKMAATAIERFTLTSIFQLGCFNADPHPGNYIFQEDRVVFLDYGCVKHWDKSLIIEWRKLITAAIFDQRSDFVAQFEAMGFVAAPEKYDADYQWMAYRHMIGHLLEDRESRLTRQHVAESQRLMFTKNPNNRYLSLPKDYVLCMRLNFGLFSILAEINAPINFHRAAIDSIHGRNTPI